MRYGRSACGILRRNTITPATESAYEIQIANNAKLMRVFQLPVKISTTDNSACIHKANDGVL